MQARHDNVDDTLPDSNWPERLFMLSPAMLCVAGADGFFKRVNPAFEQQLGHTEAAILSQPFIEFVHPDDRQATLNVLDRLSDGISAVHFENRYRHADGSYRWLLWNTTPVAEEGLLYATAIDITDRKQRKRELEENQALLVEEQAQLRRASTRLLLAEEGERRRIARGLHDDVGQTLLAAKLSVEDLLESGSLGESASSVQEIQGFVDHAIQSTRALTFELASAALYEVGVGAALQSECELAQQQSGIRFEPPDQLTGHTIPMHVKIIVHRVGRELIRNVIRHSDAQSAAVSLSLIENVVRLIVADDGQGFDALKGIDATDSTSGFGLFSIKQQLESIGGTYDITSSLEIGTRVVVTIALDAGQERQ